MSQDIEKLAVLDSRIVQSRPKFAVEKGALSLTNAPFNAIAATSSQLTFNLYVPSENVFVDRKMLWSSNVFMSMTVTLSSIPTAGDSIVVPGRDFALAMLPLNSLCSTISATINDTTSVINSQDTLYPILRLADNKRNRLVRNAPTMLDKYANYNDAFGTLANPLAGYEGMTDYDNVPNGATPFLVFTNSNGGDLVGDSAVAPFAGATYGLVNGIPVYAPAVNTGLVHTVYFRFRSTEPIVLSPFVFSDEYEWDTGLFGLNNIQLIMNLKAADGVSRVVRQCARAGRTLTNIQFNSAPQGGPIQQAVVNVQFLTPSLDVPLPPKSCVPYMEFPRYISQSTADISSGAFGQIQSQTLTLPSIPDLLIIYAKPSAIGKNDGENYLPLASRLQNVNNPLSVNFDNFSGLLSSHTTEQLYNMSVKNGLCMDYASFIGLGKSAGGSYGSATTGGAIPAGGTYPAGENYAARQQGQNVPLVGSILVLKPSQDITLQSGQAPSLVGNFTLQFNLTVFNNTEVTQRPQLFVISVNSGFFESIRGSSRIIKGVLSEQDIISAPLAPMGVRSELERMVGGFSFSALGNILSKAKDIYSSTKPIVSAVKGFLPDSGFLGKVKSGLDTVGYGTGGAMGCGTGAGTGAGTGGRKKSLASRLM
jgi:hypothetical protein